jgi:hypothetical protein
MRGRWIGLGTAATLAVGTLSGCMRPPAGYTAVAPGGSGDPVLVLAWCGRSPKQIVVTAEPSSDAAPPSLRSLVIRAPELTGNSARVNLRHPGEGWVITNSSLEVTDDSTTYFAYGESDSPDDTAPVYFTLDQVDELTATSVLGSDDLGGSQVIAADDFIHKVTSQC